MLTLCFAVNMLVLCAKFRAKRCTGSRVNAETGIPPLSQPLLDPRGSSSAASSSSC